MQGALAHLDDDWAIAQIASGTLTKTLAEQFGVAKQSLRERLAKHPRYAEAVKAQAESLVEQATAEALAVDADMPSIARARLRADVAHKWAAARDPATWSGKVDASAGNVSIQVVNYNVVIAPQNAPDSGASPRTGVMSNDAIRADATVIDVTPLPSSGK